MRDVEDPTLSRSVVPNLWKRTPGGKRRTGWGYPIIMLAMTENTQKMG
jgi:hypothetical protein